MIFHFIQPWHPPFITESESEKKDTEMKKLHTSEFDIDEKGLETGVINLSWLVYNFLSQ